jgi:hypothetical protein
MRFVAEKFPGTWIRGVEVLQNPAELSLVSMPRLQPNFYFDLVSILPPLHFSFGITTLEPTLLYL